MSDSDGMIDPNDPNLDTFKRFLPREGRKAFAITGFHRGEDSYGPTIYVGLVVVKDLDPPDDKLDPPTDEGLSSRTRLRINEKGNRWIGRFARGLKYAVPFNPRLDAGHFDEVVASNKGILIGTIKHDTFTPKGKTKAKTVSEVQGYEVADLAALGLTQGGELTEDVKALIALGETDYAEMLENAATRERSGGSAGGGGSKRGNQADDGDIPFHHPGRRSALPSRLRGRSRRVDADPRRS